MRRGCPCFTKKGETGPLQDPFKDFMYYRIETHWVVLGDVLWFTFLCIGHIMAKRQSIGATAFVEELANSLGKGSAKKQQARVPSARGCHQDQLLLRYRD